MQRPGHVVGDFAFVEGARSFARDRLQGRGKRRKANDIALPGRAAIEQIVPGGARIGFELADMALPVPRHARGHRETPFGVLDRRRKRAVETEAAVRFQNCVPGIDRARHGDRMDRIADLGQALGAQRLVDAVAPARPEPL